MTCQPGQFQCGLSGLCIPADWLCDGEADCGATDLKVDTSDEDPVKCTFFSLCVAYGSSCFLETFIQVFSDFILISTVCF